MNSRPTDRDPGYADPRESELDDDLDFDDPLAARDDSSLPARRMEPARSHDSLSAVFGQCERAGRWSVPDRLSVESWFGEVKLDFRDAEIASDGVVEVRVNAVFGQVTLRVPRGTEVELSGVSAFFGEVGSKRATKKLGSLARGWLMGRDEEEDDYEDDDDVDEEPMVLRLTGSAIFGAIHVEVD